MKIAVSEGENLIIIKTKKTKGSQLIETKRGETINIDVSKLKFETKKEGYVTFDIEPKSARVYINGRLYSNKNNILLDYGKYNYNVELTGYDSIVGALVLDEITKTIKLNLTEKATAAPSATATEGASAEVTFVTMAPSEGNSATASPSEAKTIEPTKTPSATSSTNQTQAPAETAGI